MSDSRAPLTISHKSLIELAEELGYFSSGKAEGICFGIAHMAMQAILAQEVEEFNARIQLISQYKQLDLIKLIEKVKEKYRRKGIYKKKLPNEEDRKFLDVLSFFEGVELYVKSYLYPELFEEKDVPSIQNAEKTWRLTLSDKLEKIGGISSIFKEKKFSGVYTHDELKAYLRLLEEGCKKQTSPVCFQLGSVNHAILLGYDPTKGWYFADANGLPIKNLPIENQNEWLSSDDLDPLLLDNLVDTVFKAFGDDQMTAFSTKIYSVTKSKAAVEQALMPAIDAWETAHGLDSINHLDTSEKSKWLYIAVSNGDLELVRALITAEANVNEIRNGGVAPIFIAAQNGHFEVVQELIKSKANVCQARTDGVTPIRIAIQKNRLNILSELIEADKRTIFSKDELGEAAIHFAVGWQNLAAARILLEKGTDPNFKNNDGNSPLHFAVQMKNKDMVSVLLEYKADIFLKNAESISPFLLAIKKNDLELLKCLIHGYLKHTERLQNDEKGNNPVVQELALRLIENEKLLAYSMKDSYQKKEALNAYGNEIVLAVDSQSAEKISAEFNRLNKLANALSEIERNYHPEKEERKEGKAQLKSAIENAYLSYASSKDAAESLSQLIDAATEIGNKAEADHNQTGSLRLFGTKSRLKKHIEAALSGMVNMQKKTEYLPSGGRNS